MTSPAFTAALQRVNDPDGALELLTINHASFDSPVRIVNDTRSWVSGGNTFQAFPFRLTMPQEVGGEAARAAIEIDNVGRDLMADLEALPPGAVLMATVQIASRADPDTVEWSWSAPMVGVQANAAVISASLGVDYIMRQQAVRLRHDPITSPGVFQP